MHARWLLAPACLTLTACQSIPNTGLSGPSAASVVSSGDAGVYRGLSTQGVTDQGVRFTSSIFRSTHPGASEDGLGTTDWTYVRAIEIDRAEVLAGKHNLAPDVVKFFKDCAPEIDPSNPADAIRSGTVVGTPYVRLVVTRLDWRSEIGPGPNKWEAARIPRAALEVYGATAGARKSLSVGITLSVGSIRRPGTVAPLLEHTETSVDLSRVRADCNAKVLTAPRIAIGGTGWFPRGDINNIQVEVVER